jgi:hypothetical protein
MADWYGTCRSNYFRVKDVDAFNEFCAEHEARPISDGDGRVGFISDDQYGGIPNRYDEEQDEFIPITESLAEHLAENQVCVILESGAEKARFITGQAIAIAWTGERTDLSLTDIYKQAQDEFGGDAEITEAIY